MTKTRDKIVQDLLKEANYYWYDDNADNIQPLDLEDYDPVVDKLFKANALELEKLYAEIQESQREIILGLSKALVPDQSLLPEPGYTVAQITPKADRINTSPEDSFQIVGQSDTGDKHEYYFTPLLEHQYPKCELVAMLTETVAMEVTNNIPVVVKSIGQKHETASLWLGLSISKLNPNDRISFFLGNNIVDEFDKNYYIFHAAKWLLNGQAELELSVQKGMKGFKASTHHTSTLLDTLEVDNSYEKQILTRFKDSFLHLQFPSNISELKTLFPSPLLEHELAQALSVKEPLYWIKLEFPFALSTPFIQKNRLYPNAIPLVNRRLKKDVVVKRNYDRILLPMPTSDRFLDVHRLQDARNKEDHPETAYQKVDFLNPTNSPGTYMLRTGTRVRRLNKQDASAQIHRLLEVVEEEYSTFKEEGVNRLREDFDVIEKAVNRIKSQLPKFFRSKTSESAYFCIANFRPKVSRIYYSYWETQAETIAHLGDKIGLTVSSSDTNIANSKSLIPIQKGKGALNADDYIHQIKESLLSRGRIVTRGDIELYCQKRYKKLLQIEAIGWQLMAIKQGKIGRGLVVSTKLHPSVPVEMSDYIRLELQNDLNAKSSFFTQIKVEINHGF